MTPDLQIDTPIPAPLLPGNYLPAAFEAQRSEGQGPNRILLLMPGAREEAALDLPFTEAWFFVLSAQRLARPDLMAQAMADILKARGGGSAATCAVLGPPTTQPEDLTGTKMKLPSAQGVPEGGMRRTMVIVDAGIAFWNRRFCEGLPVGGTGFRGVAYLDFAKKVSMLGPAQIADLCQKARLPNGDRVVMDELGRTFGYSHFGRWRDPLEFWHGTAVADLALDPARVGEVALFGLELPRAAIEDRSGLGLTALMPLVIQAALAMTSSPGLARLPLDIVLPYAFTGGPHDGYHRVAASIRSLLAWASKQKREVRLHLPAGNHRQDACHAVLPGHGAESVGWDLPPDDHSPSIIEIIIPDAAEEAVRLALTDPMGQRTTVRLQPDRFSWIPSQDGIVGAAARFADYGGAARLGLTLAPTAWSAPGPGLARAGRWTVEIDAPHPAHLWILRDDRDLVDDGPWPRRASRFAHPRYAERDVLGRWLLQDPPGAVVRRAGTISVLATLPEAHVVAADEVFPGPVLQDARYSGLHSDGPAPSRKVVDDATQPPGQPCLGNGTGRLYRMSGTSAAVALAVRNL